MSASPELGAASLSFSFREPEPLRPAAELLAEIRARGGRVYRMRAVKVCCLTDDREVAEWLLWLGARSMRPYRRAAGKTEWDVEIHPIPAEGSIWEAAA